MTVSAAVYTTELPCSDVDWCATAIWCRCTYYCESLCFDYVPVHPGVIQRCVRRIRLVRWSAAHYSWHSAVWYSVWPPLYAATRGTPWCLGAAYEQIGRRAAAVTCQRRGRTATPSVTLERSRDTICTYVTWDVHYNGNVYEYAFGPRWVLPLCNMQSAHLGLVGMADCHYYSIDNILQVVGSIVAHLKWIKEHVSDV